MSDGAHLGPVSFFWGGRSWCDDDYISDDAHHMAAVNPLAPFGKNYSFIFLQKRRCPLFWVDTMLTTPTTSSDFQCIGPKTQGGKAAAALLCKDHSYRKTVSRTGSFEVSDTILPAPSVSDILADELGVSNLAHKLNIHGRVVLASQTVRRPDGLLNFIRWNCALATIAALWTRRHPP